MQQQQSLPLDCLVIVPVFTKLRALQGLFYFIRNTLQSLACDRRLPFGKTQLAKLDVCNICKARLFKGFARAIQRAAVNRHYFCRSFRTFHDARYPATNTCQKKHFANAVF